MNNKSGDQIPKYHEPSRDSQDAARQVLLDKQSDLLRMEMEAKQRRTALLRELQKAEAELQSLGRRIDAIGELLTVDFPVPVPAKLSPQEWRDLPLASAAGEVLSEAGGYLTTQQIRERLEKHGRGVDDTSALSLILDDSIVEQGSPVMKIAPRLWARKDWAEQARFSIPPQGAKGH
ncbi:hypothetical protein IT570_01865 [Candidatus Sumerlaeota bacterium]|nr:hypothetical protein [Candidatus Sumerlaeota bacterium]